MCDQEMHSGSDHDFGRDRTDLSVDSTGEPRWSLLLVPSLPVGTGPNRCPVLGFTPDLSHKPALMLFRGYGGEFVCKLLGHPWSQTKGWR